MPDQPLTGGGVAVCIHEPSCGGVIIAGLEVIEAAFGIVVVATVAEWVLLGQRTGGGEDLAVGVVGITRHGIAAGVHQAHNIALQVGHIIVGGPIDLHSIRLAGRIIEEGVGFRLAVGRYLLLQQLPTLQSVRSLINLRSITCCPPPCNTTVLSMLCHHKSIDIYGNIKNYNSNQCA